MLLLLLPMRSHITYMKIFIILYNTTGLCHMKVANSYSCQVPVTVWLQLEQSVSAVHDTKTLTLFAVHCLSKCELGPDATLQLYLFFLP